MTSSANRIRIFIQRAFLGTSLLMGLVLLTACNKIDLPTYWLCNGNSTQRLMALSGDVQETYHGHDPFMLEIWGNTLYQFVQPALTGKYYQCPHPKATLGVDPMLHFQMEKCESLGDLSFSRKGALDQSSGKLSIKERRLSGNHIIQTEGTYQCESLGHTFNFAQFNDQKP